MKQITLITVLIVSVISTGCQDSSSNEVTSPGIDDSKSINPSTLQMTVDNEKDFEPTNQPPTQVVEVLADVPGVPFSTWQDTGVRLRDGDMLYIKAKGIVNVSPTQKVTPDGTRHTISRSLVPNVSFASLVGRTHYGLLDDGMDTSGKGIYGPGFVGSNFKIVFRNKAPSYLSPNRALFLAVNDSMDDDNSHSFTVRIWVVRDNKVLTLPTNDD